MRVTAFSCALLSLGCGPSSAICDEDNVTLPAVGGYQQAALVGNTSIVNTHIASWGDTEPAMSVVSDACGRNPVELETLIVLVGETPYAWEHGGNGPRTLHWIDMDPQPKVAHAVVEAWHEHVHEVGGGVVSKTQGGLVFRSDASDPNGTSTVLLDRVAPTDDIEGGCGVDCMSISDGPLEGHVVPDGTDGVLVAAPGGPIYRFSLPSGEREIVVPEPAEAFQVLEDPNYLLWSARGGGDGVWVRNRETAEDLWLDDGILFNRSHQAAFPWVVGERGHGDERTTAVLDVQTGREHVLRGHWNLSTALSDGRLLLHEGSRHSPSILDPATGALEPIEFPVSWLTVQVVGTSIIAQRDPGHDLSAVDLIRFDLSTGEMTPFESFSARWPSLQPPWLWTRAGDLLFRDSGRLIRRRLDEPRETLAEGGALYWLREHNGDEHLYYDDARGVFHRVTLE